MSNSLILDIEGIKRILAVGTAGQHLVLRNGVPTWEDSPSDVVGPSSSTDNAIVRFDSTTGKILQNSVVTIDDNGVLAGFTLATPLSIANGGTGAATAPLAQVALGIVTAVASATLTKNASEVFANIPGLTIAVTSGSTWRLKAKVQITIAGAGGAKIQIVGATPSLVDNSLSVVFFGGQKGSYHDQGLTNATGVSSDEGYIEIEATVTFGAAGNVTVQGAQYASDASDTKFWAGSSSFEGVRIS